MTNDLHRAWFPQARADVLPLDGLATLRHALIAMEAGLPLDASAARHLTAAFRAFLYEGKGDLTANLGLRSRRGRKCEAPLRLERMNRRDALIKQTLQQMGGNTPSNRAFLASLLGADDLALPSCIDFADAVHALRSDAGGRLDISERQLLRIAKGDLAYQASNKKA
jgi:hypothetical protein